MPSLVIVSNRLPVSVRRVDGILVFEQSTGGVATGLSSYMEQRDTKWVGWPGIASDDLTRVERNLITRELRKNHCYPVFLTQKQIDEFYSGYSNSVIWPLFHNLGLKPYSSKLWRGYREVNGLFAVEVLRLSKPGSAVWVHDYHLMLVPRLLRRAGRDDTIGFFLHIPFPMPQVFQELAEAKSILQGMLGADLVGFHTRSYTTEFLTNCDKLLGLASHEGRLLVGQRPVRAMDFPMGIDYERFAEATRLPVRQAELRKLQRRYKGYRLIVSVDRLDLTKGLVERMQAYQELLRQQPEWVGKLMLVMIVAPSRMDIKEHQELKQQLDTLLEEIRMEFATETWQPIDFIYKVVPLDEVMLYYQIADVGFVAPLIDGMNLVAKEFVASTSRGGALVLSETAGAAEELHDAIQVNPHELQTMVDGLATALTLPKKELRTRAQRMQARVQEFSVQKWAGSFVDTLQLASPLQARTRQLGSSAQKELVSTYGSAKKRLLVFDYDGTIAPFYDDPSDSKPTAEVVSHLQELAKDGRNDVLLVSGRGRRDLARWFGKLPITLVAEHGALVREHDATEWHKTDGSVRTWQDEVRGLFDWYAAQTPGAHVEQKEWALVWHYRTAQPFAAQKNLVALRRLLARIAKRYNLIVRDGSKILEVHPISLSKSHVVEERMVGCDFVLIAGDDATDEDMFAVASSSAYSIKVGHGKTLAHYRLADVSAMVRLLGKL